MDAYLLPLVIQTLGCGVCCLCGAMAWKDDNPDIVAASGDVLRDALRVSGLSQKEAAIEMGMDEATFSRRLDEGGAFYARLMKLRIRRPVFGAALHRREGELSRDASESPEARLERVERLLRDLHDRLPQREPVKCLDLRRRDSSDSSAA
jgi:hypothetical protein